MNNTGNPTLYGWNREFLRSHTGIVELSSGKASLVIVPSWQGRVMTSTSEGDGGFSFGWINHNLIQSGKKKPHINAYGGEERFWLGPEGGQFSIFFPEKSDFSFENWQTPEIIDTMPFEMLMRDDISVTLAANAELRNYSGFVFKTGFERKVTLLSAEEAVSLIKADASTLNMIAYSSVNRLTNTGSLKWKKETGLLSIWMLGMFNPSPAVTVVIPVKDNCEGIAGPKVNDNYFGSILPDRLKVAGNHVFFRADGKSRGKIGIPPLRVKGLMGSYDEANNILTLLYCDLPDNVTDYVNSAWEIQENPFSGDAYNSYNDGPLEDGTQMGPFYELETSSPAAELGQGESILHSQVTVHITGSRAAIDRVAQSSLGVTLETITGVFP